MEKVTFNTSNTSTIYLVEMSAFFLIIHTDFWKLDITDLLKGMSSSKVHNN